MASLSRRLSAPASLILAAISANLSASAVLARSASSLYSLNSSAMRSTSAQSLAISARRIAFSLAWTSGSSRILVAAGQLQHSTSIFLLPSPSTWAMPLLPLFGPCAYQRPCKKLLTK